MATLVSRWKFDNDYNDTQGTNNLGADGSGNSFSTSEKTEEGTHSLSLNGSGGAIKGSGVTGIDTGDADWSWGGWINWGDLPANAYLMAFGTDSSGDAWQMYTNNTTGINLTIHSVETETITYALETGVWHWYWSQYTASTNTWELYVDNVLIDSKAFASTITYANAEIGIGVGIDTTLRSTGYFDDWRIYNGVTSAGERAAIYAAGLPAATSGASFLLNFI